MAGSRSGGAGLQPGSPLGWSGVRREAWGGVRRGRVAVEESRRLHQGSETQSGQWREGGEWERALYFRNVVVTVGGVIKVPPGPALGLVLVGWGGPP